MSNSHITLQFHFRQRLADGKDLLCNLSHESYRSMCLQGSEYLLSCFGFHLPSYIRYCLATNDMYSLKYRRHGASIYIYITDATQSNNCYIWLRLVLHPHSLGQAERFQPQGDAKLPLVKPNLNAKFLCSSSRAILREI